MGGAAGSRWAREWTRFGWVRGWPRSKWYARSERGSGSMLMVGVMTVLLMFGLTGMCVAGYLVAGHRARSAADLAALSGASAFAAGRDACGAARENALKNDARVLSCQQVGDLVDYVVTVRIEVRVQARIAGLPTTLEVVAHAGSGSQ